MNNLDYLPNDGARFHEDNQVRFTCPICQEIKPIELKTNENLCISCFNQSIKECPHCGYKQIDLTELVEQGSLTCSHCNYEIIPL